LPPQPIAAIFSLSVGELRRERNPPPDTQPTADIAVAIKNVRREISVFIIT